MKKIIALAVAGAFALPAVADITISGEIEYYYQNEQDAEDTLQDAESNLFITGTSELDNGFTLTGKMFFRNTDNTILDEGGSNLTFGMGDLGTLAVGDNAGAVDKFDEYANLTAQKGAYTKGKDAAIVYTLPQLVEGLTVVYGMTPAGGSTIGGSTGEVTADLESIGAEYSFADGSAYYGVDTYTASGSESEQTKMGVEYSVAGFTLGFETLELRDDTGASTAEQDNDYLALAYSTGPLTLVYSTVSAKTDGADVNDQEILTAFYTLGSGVTAYVENEQDAVSSETDSTIVGVEYKF